MEIHVTIERLEVRLIGAMSMDIFDRIAAALGALQAGNDTALATHVAAIDSHLSDVDNEVLGLQSDDTSGKARLDAIETGLAKIADTVSPAATPAPSSSGTAANPGGGSDTGAVSGTGADAGNPGGTSDPTAQTGTGADAGNPGGSADTGATAGAPATGNPGESAPVPASGPGSETTGQVDTPDTQP